VGTFQHITPPPKINLGVAFVIQMIPVADFIGAVLGIFLCLFLFSPALLIIYMLIHSGIDIDKDGKGDTPIIWK
jgi:hypothetical protein